jgi:hypothetical protein
MPGYLQCRPLGDIDQPLDSLGSSGQQFMLAAWFFETQASAISG